MALKETNIVLDTVIKDFDIYLKKSERGILSAKYGNGKSTLLREFQKSGLGQKYLFITINTLNYQVSENQEIFEYLKREILMQILFLVELEDNDFYDIVILSRYINKNAVTIIEDIFSMFPDMSFSGVNVKDVVKPFINNAIKYKQFKKDIAEKNNEELIAEKFIKKFDNSAGSIYEFDLVSQLICNLIKRIKEKNNKEVVLVVEDLDRMDPAHIFRILNILSANIERSHPGLQEYKTTKGRNKFCLDKVLIVCDYSNIEHIFKHFYGEKTDFMGYMSKYSSCSPFCLDLRESYKEYIISNIDSCFSDYPFVIEKFATIIAEQFLTNSSKMSLRALNENLTNNYMIKNELLLLSTGFRGNNYNIRSINNFTKLLDLLRRFNIKLESIIPKDEDFAFHRQLYKLVGQCCLICSNVRIREIYINADEVMKVNGIIECNPSGYNDFSYDVKCNNDNIIESIDNLNYNENLDLHEVEANFRQYLIY